MSLTFNRIKNTLAALTICFTVVGQFSTALAQSSGGTSGGGGDANEMGVDLIRQDILKWILASGENAFRQWPQGTNANSYATAMKEYLAPGKVVVGFVTEYEQNHTNDPEQKVYVDGNAKSCRGFISTHDHRPHILCDSDRYPKGGPDQYRLIHHEFAGLAGVEKNVGSSSDYWASEQITDSLIPEVVYRLAINNTPMPSNLTILPSLKGSDLVNFRQTTTVTADTTVTNQQVNLFLTATKDKNSEEELGRIQIGVLNLNQSTPVPDSKIQINNFNLVISVAQLRILSKKLTSQFGKNVFVSARIESSQDINTQDFSVGTRSETPHASLVGTKPLFSQTESGLCSIGTDFDSLDAEIQVQIKRDGFQMSEMDQHLGDCFDGGLIITDAVSTISISPLN